MSHHSLKQHAYHESFCKKRKKNSPYVSEQNIYRSVFVGGKKNEEPFK